MRSRLRRLHIDGREFIWKADVRSAPGPDGYWHRCIRVRVWGAGKTGCALQVDLTERWHPASVEETYPFPAADDVRALIRHGVAAGWAPEARGGTFQVTSAAGPALPGFAVTDLLWAAQQR